MTPEAIFGVVALVIAACSLAITSRGLRHKTDNDYTDRLLRKIQDLEQTQDEQANLLDQCRRGREELKAENFNLLMEMYRLQRKVDG